jgi:hypothetical protein
MEHASERRDFTSVAQGKTGTVGSSVAFFFRRIPVAHVVHQRLSPDVYVALEGQATHSREVCDDCPLSNKSMLSQ